MSLIALASSVPAVQEAEAAARGDCAKVAKTETAHALAAGSSFKADVAAGSSEKAGVITRAPPAASEAQPHGLGLSTCVRAETAAGGATAAAAAQMHAAAEMHAAAQEREEAQAQEHEEAQEHASAAVELAHAQAALLAGAEAALEGGRVESTSEAAKDVCRAGAPAEQAAPP